MRLRKQSRPTGTPGAEFLRAVSSGRGSRPVPTAPPPTGDSSDLQRRLLESEQRAVAADEALRQIREETSQRLEQARAALARERRARIDAEHQVHQLQGQAVPEQSVPNVVAEPEPSTPARMAEPDHEHDPALTFEEREALPPGEDGESDWPAPWLDEKRPRKRGLFRRSGP